MKYFKFTLLVGVDEDEVIPDVVETDLRDLIENGYIGEIAIPYGIVVSDLQFEGEETRQ